MTEYTCTNGQWIGEHGEDLLPDEVMLIRETYTPLYQQWGYRYRAAGANVHSAFEMKSPPWLQAYTDPLMRNLQQICDDGRDYILSLDSIQIMKRSHNNYHYVDAQRRKMAVQLLKEYLGNQNTRMLLLRLATTEIGTRSFAFVSLIVAARVFLCIADGMWKRSTAIYKCFIEKDVILILK